jgi:hypothetical protein
MSSAASHRSVSPALRYPHGRRPYLLRFIAIDDTHSLVAFANRDEHDERAQLLTLGASVTLATARGAV